MSGSTSSGNYIGSGSDTISLNMSEDQALGVDAQFSLNVDGQQIGGPQTVSASHAAGQDQTFTFAGNFAPGPHNVTVTFANNFIYPGVAGDRNVYVDGVSYDGQTVSNSTTPIYETPFFPPNSTEGNVSGNAVFAVNDTTAVPAGAPSTPTTTPGPVSVGSGADTLVLNMAEDPYQGDAQFTVSVDGKQIGGTQTTTAVVDQGQAQEFDVHGDFGGGAHTVTVNYLNDQIGGYYPAGTPGLPAGMQWALDSADRNLYVMGMSLNGGTPASGAPWELSSNGSMDFGVTAGSNPSATGSNSSLFTSNGSAANGNNAVISSASLASGTTTSGSASGMNFVASATTPAATASGSNTATPSAPATTTDTAAPAMAMAAAPTTQDFTTPATTGTSATDTSGTTSGSSAAWSMNQQMASMSATPTHHHHG